ncbi:MAG: tRNA pseudouridine(38-40) synthase TruA [bacterium]|nr:MAG: tRNA pseudouridine(38-40) synthase TruA [bacterium]
MRRIRLLLEYDGTSFSGWQIQPDARTVQGVLEEALSRMMESRVRILGSGRTDAGVHALGQVAHADVDRPIPPWNIMMGLNSTLPPDVRVLKCEEADRSFHAQRSATGKTYRYVILNRSAPTALDRNRVWHIRQPLDVDAMSRGASHLLGRHDFAAFKSAGDETTTVRDLRRLHLCSKAELLTLDFEADGFLKHMVRTITGALVEVGTGRMDHETIRALLEARSREGAPRKAPGRGLYLVSVNYETPDSSKPS